MKPLRELWMRLTGTGYKRKSTRLLGICEGLIDKYETTGYKMSCKGDVMAVIRRMVAAAKQEISEEWDDSVDYVKVAHTLLSHATFDLLVSGRYHIYYGMLNPMSCADNLMDVYKSSMVYGIHAGLLDEETRQEQYEYLLKRISEAG